MVNKNVLSCLLKDGREVDAVTFDFNALCINRFTYLLTTTLLDLLCRIPFT